MIESRLSHLSRFVNKFVKYARHSSASLPKVRESEMASQDTGLHRFEEVPKEPFTLFKKWHGDLPTENYISSNAFCLSTATKNGKVSSRNLLLRRLDEDGFVLMTDNRSKKSKELEENPYAAMTFLWVSEKEGKFLTRQVRIEGEVVELPTEDWADIYEKEPLFAKIRAQVCDQGQKIEWEDLKMKHDKVWREYEEGRIDLSKPEHVVAYKMHPAMMEFYEALGPQIADRVMYLKDKDEWEPPMRIAA